MTEETGPLVGRTALLAALEARLAAGGSAVLTGPRGIGKTTVLEAVAATAAARGELVLRASGAPSPQSHGPTRRPFGLAWRSLLARCAADRPVLLLVDDAQWLDGPTVDALRRLPRLPRLDREATGPGVRAVTAGRWPEGTAPAIAPAIPLPPLTPGELAGVLAPFGLPSRVVHTLHADSGGNPHLALALADAFADRVPRHWRPAPLPQRTHDMITERLAALPAPTRETLLVAASATRPTVGLLRRAGRSDAAHDVRLAAVAGLLVTEVGTTGGGDATGGGDEGGTVRFTPPAVATVLAERADPAHRAEVHTTLATVVPDAAGRLRHRVLAAPAPDAALVRALVAAAGTASRQGAHRTAAELYLLAADRSPYEPGAHRARLEWLVAAAEAGAGAGLPALVHRAADAVLDSDASRAQRTRVRIALLDLSGQGLSEMDEVFAAALLDAGGDPALTGPLRLRMSWSALLDGRPGRGSREALAAAGQARAAGDTATEAMALGAGATASMLMGRDDARTNARALLDRALHLPEPPPNGRLHASPRFVAARFAVFEDRLTEARGELLRMLAQVERGSGEEVVHVLRALAEVSVRMGRCRDALDYADRAVRATVEASLSPGPAWWDAAVAELAGGSVDRARGYAEAGLCASVEERDALFTGRHLHVLGLVRIRSGDVRGGVEALLRVEALERRQGVRAPLALRWQGDLASGLAALGETGRAEEVVRAARAAVGSRARGAGVTGQLDRAEAAVLAARGDSDTALELLRDAERRFEELGQPLERGHCLLERARIERRRRRQAAARAAVGEALELFGACGARPWAELAGRSLDRLGAANSPARSAGRAREGRGPAPRRVLTDNEARIAELVGEGATNQEVAARLFLSVKTIEASLTRIYRKLGVRSRTQLGTWLRSGAGSSEARFSSAE